MSETYSAQAEAEAWLPRRLKETRLRELVAQLASDPHSTALLFERAGLLSDVGRDTDARDAYLDLLSREPSHRAALNNLGMLLHRTGYRTAARTAFAQAVAKHPEDRASRVNLANAQRENGDTESARDNYETALRLQTRTSDAQIADAHLAEAHQGLACVLADIGDRQRAAHYRQMGFGSRPVMTLPYRGEEPPVHLLVLSGTSGGNVSLRHFLDDRVFQTSIIFVEFYGFANPLPRHQLVVNAIGDADSEAPALAAAQRMLALTRAPVINLPEVVAATGRSGTARLLSGIPGVVTPRAITLPRGLLAAQDAGAPLADHGFEFPLLIRTPGFHTGRHFLRVETITELPAALGALPGEDLTVLSYLDARGADGKIRKYRVMMINGELYPLHAAISGPWKIHYFTAEMAGNPAHRAEDAAFLENMHGVLGPGGMAALAEIQSRLGLDYAGIDFGLNAKGEILLFEANATMVVNPPEPDEKWAYRRPAVERIHTAVRNMLMERSGSAEHKGWNSSAFQPMSSAWKVSCATPNPSLK